MDFRATVLLNGCTQKFLTRLLSVLKITVKNLRLNLILGLNLLGFEFWDWVREKPLFVCFL